MLFSRWLARTTKRTLCSPTSTVPHAILPSHEGPSPPPSPRRSVKDVLTTPRKGCHETEHRNGCATKPQNKRGAAKANSRNGRGKPRPLQRASGGVRYDRAS